MTNDIKATGIKHSYRTDKKDIPLELSLKVPFIKSRWVATLKKLWNRRKSSKTIKGTFFFFFFFSENDYLSFYDT